MDRDPRLELEEDTKAADLPTVKEMRDLSVQDRAEKETTGWGLDLSILLSWPSTDPEGMPPWPSSARDARLREFWPEVPLLAAVITAFVSRIKTLPYRIEADDENDATYWNWVLSNGDFGKGWGYTIGKAVLDLLTQDNGLFIEILRPAKARGAKGLLPLYRLGPDTYAVKSGDDYIRLGKRALKAVTDDPWETPVGIAHLDAGKCVRLRDPETPVQYRSQKGARPLKTHQVFDASWMTSAEENRAGYGMCPVTLALIASRITKNIDTYVDEKVGGRYFKRILYGTNIFQGRLEAAIKEAEAQADARGQTRYATNVVVGSADLTSPGEVGVLDLTGLPDGFDRETEYDIAADLITACFGLDRPEVIPMRTATLGQAGQVGVMAMKARGKGVAEVIRLVERFVSNWLLPSDGSVRFAFDYKDDEEDARRADIKNKEADTLVKLAGAPTADGVPPFTRSEFRALCQFYELVPEKMLTEEEKEETPAVEQEEEEKAIGLGARLEEIRCRIEELAEDFKAKGPGRGWWGPPKGTHGEGKERRPGRAPEGPDVSTVKAMTFLTKGETGSIKVKDAIVTTLSERSGTTYDETNEFIKHWAFSSGDDHPHSLAIQKNAAAEFDVPESNYIKSHIEGIDWSRVRPKLMEDNKQRVILRSMYENTQEGLRNAGFKPGDTVRLRRGIKLPISETKDWKRGEVKSIQGNPLDSWSVDRTNAQSFAARPPEGYRGVVFEMDVPIESILSTAKTGFGCLDEREFVTLGSTGDARVILITPLE